MVAQTTPSKLERARLAADIADMAGCDVSVADAVISRVLKTYDVCEAPKPPKRLVRLMEALRETQNPDVI